MQMYLYTHTTLPLASGQADTDSREAHGIGRVEETVKRTKCAFHLPLINTCTLESCKNMSIFCTWVWIGGLQQRQPLENNILRGSMYLRIVQQVNWPDQLSCEMQIANKFLRPHRLEGKSPVHTHVKCQFFASYTVNFSQNNSLYSSKYYCVHFHLGTKPLHNLQQLAY